jgi:hypothetical protein
MATDLSINEESNNGRMLWTELLSGTKDAVMLAVASTTGSVMLAAASTTGAVTPPALSF